MSIERAIPLLQQLDQLDKLRVRVTHLEYEDQVGIVVVGGPQIDLPFNSMRNALIETIDQEIRRLVDALGKEGITVSY